ncbi:MAG: hypothetical protein KDJ66_15450, partial [Nitratireductor sp.]|nr:hypothetical protein [Nitratireductor sp.]
NLAARYAQIITTGTAYHHDSMLFSTAALQITMPQPRMKEVAVLVIAQPSASVVEDIRFRCRV